MKPISFNRARLLAGEVSTEMGKCEKCLFKAISCTQIDCAVGNMLKRLADEGFLSIDESAEGGAK